jgi:o-succinylbenzoate synthase
MIWISRYELIPRTRLNHRAAATPRRGALLRVGSGFADLHPWPELGDLDLDQQFELLRSGSPTAQTRASLALAAIDGEARERGVSLFEGLEIPPSHWPAAAGAVPPGFDTVKVKCGPTTRRVDLEPYSAQTLRLDFNETLESIDAEPLGELRGLRIDFIEDPVPYQAEAWRALKEKSGLRLAIDRQVATNGVDVLVHKPALSGVELPEFSGEIVVTSYMDHPVGQMGAAYVAAVHRDRLSPRCGLFTHPLFEADAFMDAIRSDGSTILAPEGTGIGFDEQLARLNWTRLQ